jgi:hypothetical protein
MNFVTSCCQDASPSRAARRPQNRFGRSAAAVFLAAMVACSGAMAQEFPSRPIRIFAPQAAGGPNDILIRVLADKVKDTLRSRWWWRTAPARAAWSRPRR